MSKYFFLVIIFILWLYLIFTGISLFYNVDYYSDLFSSFLPYTIAFNLCLILAFLKLDYFKKFKIIRFISIVFLLGFSVYGIYQMVTFFYIKDSYTQAGKENIKVSFFNKLFANSEYESIQTRIKEINPDIAAFAEMSNESYNNLKLDYPYVYKTKAGSSFFARTFIAIYSKYPITNIQNVNNDDSPIFVGEMKKGSSTFTIIAVHLKSPVNQTRFDGRNFSMDNIVKYVKAKNTIVMGDFNTSIYSYYYKQFLEKSKLNDAHKGSGFNFTWGLFGGYSFIDHILISKNLGIVDSYVEWGLGSDHNLIWSNISY